MSLALLKSCSITVCIFSDVTEYGCLNGSNKSHLWSQFCFFVPFSHKYRLKLKEHYNGRASIMRESFECYSLTSTLVSCFLLIITNHSFIYMVKHKSSVSLWNWSRPLFLWCRWKQRRKRVQFHYNWHGPETYKRYKEMEKIIGELRVAHELLVGDLWPTVSHKETVHVLLSCSHCVLEAGGSADIAPYCDAAA